MPRHPSQGIVGALLFGTLALIAYGSLYPFDIRPGAEFLGLWEALGHVTWARAGRGDRIANLLLYVPLGFCLFRWLESRVKRRVAALIAVVFGIALSYCIEVTQVFIALRVASYWDVVFNGIGSIVGAIAGLAWYELSARLNNAAGSRVRSDRSAVFVVVLWLTWRLWPFIPQISIGRLKASFQPLADPFFALTVTLHYLVWWTLLAQMVFVLVGGQRGIEALLALIAIVLVGCLFVANHGFVPSELLALVLLLPTLLVFNRLTLLPRRWLLLTAFIGIFLYDSLMPLQVSATSGHFDLWPFMTWIDSGFPIGWQWLAQRACYFAALVWLLRETGMPSRTIALCVPCFVLLIEIARTWIAGRNGSITEPVIALLIAATMHALDGGLRRDATLRRARTH